MADWLAFTGFSFTPESRQKETSGAIPDEREIIWRNYDTRKTLQCCYQSKGARLSYRNDVSFPSRIQATSGIPAWRIALRQRRSGDGLQF